MSEWWDEHAGRYRTSLPYKVFYAWGWPLIRRAMFAIPDRDLAHHVGIRGIWLVDRVERAWQGLVLVSALVLMVVCWPILKVLDR
jgi:hypothetical protein